MADASSDAAQRRSNDDNGSQAAAERSCARSREILEQIAGHPEKRLILSRLEHPPATLAGIDLGRQRLTTEHHGAAAALGWDLAQHGAILRHADLRGADLREANLEEADLSASDLAGVDCSGANLGEVNFQTAMLEDCNLRDSNLRFADFRGSILESANLQNADMWGANLDGAVLIGASLQGALLEEASLQGADLERADLSGAILRKANLQGADLRSRADLQGAILSETNLESAILQDARLQALVLTNCNLRHLHASDAWLERTQLRHDQLDGALGEELAGQYDLARRGYLALERNFEGLGDHDAASWAYRRKRRMQKRESLRRGRQALQSRSWYAAADGYGRFAIDQLVEWVCDYGESVTRVLASLVVSYLLFIVLYGLTGSVVRTDGPPSAGKVPTTRLVDLAVFSLMAMTTSGNPSVKLEPSADWVHLLTGLEALLGIALTGLLGFVAGNRIRR